MVAPDGLLRMSCKHMSVMRMMYTANKPSWQLRAILRYQLCP